jgi:hypothetical protein
LVADPNLKKLYEGFLNVYNELRTQFNRLESAPSTYERSNAYIRLKKMIDYMGPGLIRRFYNMMQQQNKTQSLINNMVKFADYLDSIGELEFADRIDEIISSGSIEYLLDVAEIMDLQKKYALADKLTEIINKNAEVIQSPSEGTLSNRYCPDHIGVQTIRISEKVYQCPIDGKIYNYETGYVNYKGEHVLGGSVAAQTPETSNYGGIPMRIYDSRANILNRIN